VGAAVYLPWRRFEAFYAIPFLVGPAGILAIAGRGLMGASPARTGLVSFVFVALLSFPGLSAFGEASLRTATRWVNWEVARSVFELGPADSLHFAVPDLPDQEWQGRGPTIARYSAAVFGGPAAVPSTDRTCQDVGGRLGQAPTQREFVVSYHHWCGALPNADVTVTREFPFIALPSVIPQRGRISADLLVRDPPRPGEGGPGR
jgi:hypothetical protein